MIRTPKAREILTKAELELFLNSLARTVKKFDATQLRSYVARSRGLRDKYKDLAKRQQREARGKAPARGSRAATMNERTVVKEQLFGEVLARYEAALAKAPAREAAKKSRAPGSKQPLKRAKKKASKKKKAARKKTAKKKAAKRKVATKKAAKKRAVKKSAARPARGKAGPTSLRRTASAKAARVTRGGSRRKTGHTAARGRRSQARRDSRGGRRS